MHELAKLKGVGLSVASAILAFHNPKKYAIIDRRVRRALNDKYNIWISQPPNFTTDMGVARATRI